MLLNKTYKRIVQLHSSGHESLGCLLAAWLNNSVGISYKVELWSGTNCTTQQASVVKVYFVDETRRHYILIRTTQRRTLDLLVPWLRRTVTVASNHTGFNFYRPQWFLLHKPLIDSDVVPLCFHPHRWMMSCRDKTWLKLLILKQTKFVLLPTPLHTHTYTHIYLIITACTDGYCHYI